MKYRINTALQVALIIADLTLLFTALYSSGLSRDAVNWRSNPMMPSAVPSAFDLYLAVGFAWLVVTLALGTYKAVQNRLAYQDLGQLLKAAFFSTILLSGFMFLTTHNVSRLHFWYFVALSVPLLMVFRLALRVSYRLLFNRAWGSALIAPARVVVVGEGIILYDTLCTLSKCDPREVALLGYIDYQEDMEQAIGETEEHTVAVNGRAPLYSNGNGNGNGNGHKHNGSLPALSTGVLNGKSNGHAEPASKVAVVEPIHTAASIRAAARNGDGPGAHGSASLQSAGYDAGTLSMGEDSFTGKFSTGALAPLSTAIENLVITSHADNVVVAISRKYHNLLAKAVAELQRLPVHIILIPDVADLTILNVGVTELADAPALKLRAPILTDVQLALKRVLDLTLVLMAMPFLLPIMAVVAVAIKLDSPGSIVFKQRRVGQYGKQFTIYKFRTMVQDAETRLLEVTTYTEDGKPLFKSDVVDPRVTKVGRILRRLSLDELPQLFNVLMGQMSLVGPRPELPRYVGFYETWQHFRLWVPPGITGWWQIKGRERQPMYLYWDDDLYYIRNYSLLLDLQILWLTVSSAVLGSTGR